MYQLQEPASRDAARVNVSRFNAALDMSGVRQAVLQAAAALPLDLRLTALSRWPPASVACLAHNCASSTDVCWSTGTASGLHMFVTGLNAPPAGGYILSYENNNVSPTDVYVDTRLTRLPFVIDYPNNVDDATLLWLQR